MLVNEVNRHLKLIAGEKGINEPISWFHYMEDPNYLGFLKGGELVLTTGMMFGGDEKELLRFMTDLTKYAVSGLIINLSPYLKRIPDSVIELGNELNLPTYELPAAEKIIDMSQDVCRLIFEDSNNHHKNSDFFRHLVYDSTPIRKSVMHDALKAGFNNWQTYELCVVEVTSVSNMGTANNALKLQTLESFFLDNMPEGDAVPLSFIIDDLLIFILPDDSKQPLHYSRWFKNKCDQAKEQFQLSKIQISFSPSFTGISQIRPNYQKAMYALSIAESDEDAWHVIKYTQLDVWRIFYELNDADVLASVEKQILNPIDVELVDTLKMFVENNCNLEETADALFIHVNTLRYRFRKLKKVFQVDIHNSEDLFKIKLALKIRAFLSQKNGKGDKHDDYR